MDNKIIDTISDLLKVIIEEKLNVNGVLSYIDGLEYYGKGKSKEDDSHFDRCYQHMTTLYSPLNPEYFNKKTRCREKLENLGFI